MTIVISMWSGPRNISTTMMRSFANREDTVAVDEPLYGYYLQQSGAAHPYRDETLSAWPTTYESAVEWMNAPRGKPLTFLKQIAYHLPSEAELSFIVPHKNFLLIRDPRKMVASFASKYDDAAPIIESYAVERRIFNYLAARGIACPVVDAADILAAPETMLRKLCSMLEIAFDKAMLAWPAGARPEDGPWAAHWYDAVTSSTGFRTPVEKSVDLSPELEAIADTALADYRALHEKRLTA